MFAQKTTVTAVSVSDHSFLSFGSVKFESLEWEKRSVFNRNKRQEEIEDFKSLGLVSRKKAYFEQYFKKRRALKAMEETQQSGISSITDQSEEASHGFVSEMRNTDEDSQVQSTDLDSASSTLQMSTKVQLDSESTLLESFIRTEETENQDTTNLDETDMLSKLNKSDLRDKQEEDSSNYDVHAHQRNKIVEQKQVSSTDAQDTSKKNCTSESNVQLHLATAGTVLHQTNSDAVMSDCNIVQRKSSSNVRECRDRILVSRVKVPAASAKKGLKEENKSQRNTSVPLKYQFQQKIGQRNDNVGSSNTISDKVLRNCRLISVASHKPLISARSKSTVPCPFSFGPERRTKNNAPSFQNISKDAAMTCNVNNKSDNKRDCEQVRERILTRGPMRRAAKLREPQQDQKRKEIEIKRISLPINQTVPNHCKPHGGGEYRYTMALRKNEPKKDPIASFRNGVEVNHKSRTNQSQDGIYQYQRILNMMKNKRGEELQLLKSNGLVTQKRSLFEEYYKRRRALKAIEEIKQAKLTQQYGGYDPITSQGGRDETSVHIESLGSTTIVAHTGSALLEPFPRNSENSDMTQERNSIHHRERWPTDHTLLIRAEHHRLSGYVGTSKKNCNLESNVGCDLATTGNVLHPANSNAAKSVCNILQEKGNSDVLKFKENIPVKKEKGPVTSVIVGVKGNQKGKANTSQARSYQYHQILSMMKSKREKELQNLKSTGLVAQKRAFFEEYYKRSRALKAKKEITQSELTRQYDRDDPMTSPSGLDETSVCLESLSDEMSNVIAADSGSELLESFPRTKEIEIHDNMDFNKKEISRKSDNSESDTKQEKNSLSCEVRIHHRERLPRDHTLLIRAERHQLSGLVGSSKKNCKLKSKIGSDIATTGNVLHPANSHAVKPVRDNLLKKANAHVTMSKENIPVKKEEETVASVRKSIISIPVDSYKPLRDGLFQGTSSKAASLRRQGTEIKRGSEQEQDRVSATSRMGRVANVSELLKARTLRPFNLRSINQSNPHGGNENRSTIALRKVELKEFASSQTDKGRRPLSDGMSYNRKLIK